MCSIILLVFVSSKPNPGHAVLVYAIVDSHKDSCLILEKNALDLKMIDSRMTFSLSTMFEASSRDS